MKTEICQRCKDIGHPHKYPPSEMTTHPNTEEKLCNHCMLTEIENPLEVFVICSVRNVSDEYKEMLDKYVSKLEENNVKVHLPHRDTNQEATGLAICIQNKDAIRMSDEVHVFYSSLSQGTHFDMGIAFAYNKKIIIVENESFSVGKSYAKMIHEWAVNHKN